MGFHNRNYIRALVMTVMASVVLAMGIVEETKSSNAKIEQMQTEESGGQEFGLYVWMNHQQKIKSWYNQQDNSYYLFIPGAMEGKKLNLTFLGAESLSIDDRKVGNGDKCRLKEGHHTIRTGEPQDSKTYDLEVMYTSGIASLFLETESGTLEFIHESKENEESGSMYIMDNRGSKYYEGTIEDIHCRGNSSYEDTDKKSYSIKLSKKADLFGMGEDRKWILTANAFDDTLLRNTIAFDIAKSLELAYTPDVEYVDVWANGAFIGNYLLSEKIEVGKNRVNIGNFEDEMMELNGNPEPETLEFFMEQQGRLFSTKGYQYEKELNNTGGGYLLELETSDRYGLEASGFLTSRMQPVVFASPKYASYDQVSYIANRYQDFEDAVFSEDGYSPYTGAAYSDYIDMDSFARKYLVEELTKNLDASFTSQYLYKYADSVSEKFYAGPCWDYDKSIAASGITEDGIDLHDPDGLYAAVQEKDSDIWYALYQHEDFRRLAAEIFFEELEPQLKADVGEMIYGYASLISASNDCNMMRWNTFPQAEELSEKRELHQDKVDELVEFLDKRLDFLESEWGDLYNE